MFIRKITEHVKAQNWFAVILDFFIVVVGVFVGIQVDNWNQDRIDKNNESEYLVLIDGDLKRDVEVLELLRSNIQQHVDGAQLVRDSVYNSVAPTEAIEKAFTSLYQTYAYTPAQPTYLGLRNGAQLEILEDLGLRSSIIDYYDINQSRFQMEFMRDYTRAQRLLHQHFSKYVKMLPPNRTDKLWPPPEGLLWTTLVAPLSSGVEDIGFLNDLSEVGARGGEILQVIRELQSTNRSIQSSIQQYLYGE